MRIQYLCSFAVVALTAAVGCGPQTPNTATVSPKSDTPAGASTVPEEATSPQGDTADVTAALEASGAELKRDDDGFVIEVSFRGVEQLHEAAVFPQLPKLTKLRALLLNDTNVTDDDLVDVGQISTLENLDLRGCVVSNAGMAHLAGLKSLKALRLSGKDGGATVDDKAFADLSGLVKLKVLAVDGLWVGEEGLAALKNAKDLEEVYMAGTLAGDETLKVLAEFTKLKKLRVSQTQITGEGLAQLKTLSNLSELDISECAQLNDEAMAHLAGLTALTRLNLWRVPITDAGVAHLAGLTNLQWLNLDNTQLSDAGLPYLKDMTALTFLHLGSTAISNAGLPALESLTSLKDLKVTRTAVTEEGVQSLQEKLPNTAIQLKYIAGQ